MKEDVAYQEWLKEVTGKLPTEVQEAFKAVTEHEAGKEIFRGISRREDYNRRVNEVENTRKQLNTWWEQEKPRNEKLIEERAALVERASQYERQLKEYGLLEDAPGGTTRIASAPSVVKKEELSELEKRLADRITAIDRALPSFLGDFADTIYKTAKEGYNVTPREVLAHAMENNLSPGAAFDALTYTEREKRAAENAKKDQEKWKEEGRRQALSQLSSPAQIRPAGPNILDTLRDKEFRTDQRSRVDAAVKEFMEGDFQASSNLV